MSPTILITGPVRSLSAFAQAARDADWSVVERPLLEIRDVEPQLDFEPGVALERILITSRNAVRGLDRLATDWLELRELPCSIVGATTADVLRQADFAIEGEPAASAERLAERLASELPESSTVLWPRGSVSDELAERLRSLGHTVLDPIVYRTETVDDASPLPATDAVFLASPSAVRAWGALDREGSEAPFAVAIGPTTRAALESRKPGDVRDILSLARPDPKALSECLRDLAGRLDS